MKQTLNNILIQNSASVITVVLICAFAGLVLGCFGYFLSLAVMLLALWSTGFDFKRFGVIKRPWTKNLKKAIAYSLLLFIIVDILLSPVVEHLFGDLQVWIPYLTSKNPIIFLLISISILIVTVLIEEFVYRGYFMRRLARSLGGSDATWFISAIIISSTIGTIGIYSGPSGMLINGITCFLLCMIFFINRRNLQLCMLIHANHNLVILILILMGKERAISEWMLNLPLN